MFYKNFILTQESHRHRYWPMECDT